MQFTLVYKYVSEPVPVYGSVPELVPVYESVPEPAPIDKSVPEPVPVYGSVSEPVLVYQTVPESVRVYKTVPVSESVLVSESVKSKPAPVHEPGIKPTPEVSSDLVLSFKYCLVSLLVNSATPVTNVDVKSICFVSFEKSSWLWFAADLPWEFLVPSALLWWSSALPWKPSVQGALSWRPSVQQATPWSSLALRAHYIQLVDLCLSALLLLLWLFLLHGPGPPSCHPDPPLLHLPLVLVRLEAAPSRGSMLHLSAVVPLCTSRWQPHPSMSPQTLLFLDSISQNLLLIISLLVSAVSC
ncbi:hypothetical protein DPX16_14037 [Anabarilius grahami]|uniref:Uncharacterized protein n=1 Tax=Anabarilius grahami TaxID=495550 RepID=A0A3N0Y9Y3_ANAGA|nr:hypothetical protein DPX16_14037 [Anabarilius grahami]